MSRYENLFREVAKCKPKTILEIGTWNGQHAREMIETAAIHYPKDDLVYYGFDLWEELSEEEYIKEGMYPKKVVSKNEAILQLKKTGIEFYLIQGNTVETLAKFRPEFPIDFVFVDGGHSPETIASDWKNIQRIIHSETIILFDDYYKNNYNLGCAKLIDTLIEEDRFLVDFLLPIDDINGKKIQMVKVYFETIQSPQ